MPTRRLNFTKCKRISHKDVRVTVQGNSFTAALALGDYRLPHDAPLVLEAFADWTVMRFAFGTVGAPQSEGDSILSEFDAIDGVRFRLKVLEESGTTGLILAEADQIRPRLELLEDAGRSFLLVRPADLGSVGWQLSFDERQPILLVNSAFSDWRGFTKTEAFRGLVLPEIYRGLLRAAAEEDVEDESESWQASCLKIASSHLGEDAPISDPEALDSWIQQAVDTFSRRHKVFRAAQTAIED